MSSLSVEECSHSEVESPDQAEIETVMLAIPENVRLKISPEDFETLCQFNRDLRLERTAEGELIAMSPAGFRSGWLELEIGAELRDWAKRDRTGSAFSASTGFTLPNGAVRSPDASWIAEDRWKALTDEQKDAFAPIVPDFVIEVCSPSDRRQKTREKMVEYIEQGVRLGWLIDPRKPDAEVEIYRPGKPVELLIKPQSLSGEDVLPVFVLDLNAILSGRP